MILLLWPLELVTGGSINTFYNLRLLGFNRYSYFNWGESLILAYNGYLSHLELGGDASLIDWVKIMK